MTPTHPPSKVASTRTTEPTVFVDRPLVHCAYCDNYAPLGRWKGKFQQQRGRVDQGDGSKRTRLKCLKCGLSFPLVEESEESEVVG
ncbi:MAG: hypothetical protein AAGI54_02510 [Planctomycetota bacterium]